MRVFFDDRGKFGFMIPDGPKGTVAKVWRVEGELLCSECGDPIKPGDLIIYQDWRSEGEDHRKHYHERHASALVREQYARWVRIYFPEAGAPK